MMFDNSLLQQDDTWKNIFSVMLDVRNDLEENE